MSVFYSPKIVTSDLTLLIDAGNPRSYPGAGGVVTDLSGKGFNGGLNNGVAYSSSIGRGTFVFGGGTEYINFGNIATGTAEVSLCAWVRINAIGSDLNIFSRNGPYFLRVTSAGRLRIAVLNGISWNFANGATTTLSANTWYYLVMTYDGMRHKGYINGVQEIDSIYVGAMPTLTASMYVGYTPISGEQGPFNGYMGVVSMYSRALQVDEINQNYLAHKSRFV